MARRTTRLRSSRRAVRLDFGAIEIIGGLLTPDIVARIAAFEAHGQDEESYRVPPGLKIRDEIARYFRIGEALWAKFDAARAASPAASERFALELLQQCFGFDTLKPQATVRMGEREFPVRHAALDGRVPVVIAPVPPATARRSGLDESLAQFGDGARRRSATLLLQEYLNASEDAAWGLTLDGLTLRLMRDNVSLTRPAWIEADLAKIFSEGLFPDFSALWLLIHQSRFGKAKTTPTESSLEQWRDTGRVEGVAARDKLRRGVEAALIELGQGFIEHQANGGLRQALTEGKLSRQGYFEELLRLVYRLIFLFAAEDRELLHAPGAPQAATKAYAEGYSLARLRERCMRRTAWDRHGDSWEGLKATFTALGKGETRLGLPALGGLFASDQLQNLTACKLDNRRLLAAIWRLAWMRPDAHPLTRVNWRDMETEELGSVYESLLELTPIASADTRTFTFAEGDETRGNARKVSGSYYTPDSLVQALLDETLDPLIEETVAGKDDATAIEALLNLRIIDPACGSGHFLLAAARRLASRIARLSSPGSPSEADYRHWLREVARRSLFGVDRNPMAIELAKVALWIETVEPGKPLSFLDAHLRCGDSLLGVYDLKALEIGIPDDAYKPLTGDDKAAATAWRKLNKQARERDDKTIELAFTKVSGDIAGAAQKIEAQDEDELAGVEAKRKAFEALLEGQSYWRVKTACDLYVAAFLLPKLTVPKPEQGEKGVTVPTTSAVRDKLSGLLAVSNLESIAFQAAAAARAFHWPLEFPQVFFPAAGRKAGFDLALGNPPWERIKLQEQEFFSVRDPKIAKAATKTDRQKLIDKLELAPQNSAERALFDEFIQVKRIAEVASVFSRIAATVGGRFPLTGTGDVNTYALFAELFTTVARRAGLIVPTGIATDYTYRNFFEAAIANKRLAVALMFDNQLKLFPSVHPDTPFGIFAFAPCEHPVFAAYLLKIEHLDDARRRFALTHSEISTINPNTRTAPIFRSKADAELTRQIYSVVPIFGRPARENGWEPIFFKKMFDFGIHASLLVFSVDQPSADHLPIYEAKMVSHYNHRFSTYEGVAAREVALGTARDASTAELQNPNWEIRPRCWTHEKNFIARMEGRNWNRLWFLSMRDVTNATNERTAVFAVRPRLPANDKLPSVFVQQSPREVACLLSNLSSLTFDYVARQKVGGTNLGAYLVEQLPVLPPSRFPPEVIAFIAPRVLELTYTSRSMKPFAEDLGYSGPPFSWNEDRRALLRAELDAKIAQLYGLTRDQLRYILDPADIYGSDYPSETFRVLKNNDFAKYGEYRTAKLVLQAFDQLTAGTMATEVVRLDADKIEDRTQAPTTLPLTADSWARSRIDARGETGAMVAALLKAIDGPTLIRQLRLAAVLALEPRLLAQQLDMKLSAEWQRLIGDEARLLPRGTVHFVPPADETWGATVRGLRARGNLVEDLRAGTWAPGTGLDKIETEGWPDGRAGFVLEFLRSQGNQPVFDALPEEARRWLDAEAA